MPRPPALLLAALLLAGCASPSAEFFGAPSQRVTVEGVEIVVYHRGARAQAIRMGRLARGEHGVTQARMVVATEQVTGCAVTDAQGDSGVMTLRLAC